jgi:hypothetical protein
VIVCARVCVLMLARSATIARVCSGVAAERRVLAVGSWMLTALRDGVQCASWACNAVVTLTVMTWALCRSVAMDCFRRRTMCVWCVRAGRCCDCSIVDIVRRTIMALSIRVAAGTSWQCLMLIAAMRAPDVPLRIGVVACVISALNPLCLLVLSAAVRCILRAAGFSTLHTTF